MALQDGLGGGTGLANINHEINVDTLVSGTTRLYFRDAGIFLQSDIDGGILVSTDGTTGNTIKLKLGDKVGNANVTVLDSDDFPMNQLDSDGNVKHKGNVRRTSTNE